MMIGGSLPDVIVFGIGVEHGAGRAFSFPPLVVGCELQAERAESAGAATSAVAIVLAKRRRDCLVIESEDLDMGFSFLSVNWGKVGRAWFRQQPVELGQAA